MAEILGIQRSHPQRFSEIVGQDEAVGILRQHALNGSMSRAFLLHGAKGSGKRALARVFAQAMLCTDPSDGEPCCVCEPCCLAHQSTLADEAEWLHLHPDRFTVRLINNAHLMLASDQREFVQVVGRPWEDDLWVLITTEPHKVPYAVREPCVAVGTNLISAEVMTAHLRGAIAEAGLDMSDGAVAHAVAAGAGSMGAAWAVLDLLADRAKKRHSAQRTRPRALAERLRLRSPATTGA